MHPAEPDQPENIEPQMNSETAAALIDSTGRVDELINAFRTRTEVGFFIAGTLSENTTIELSTKLESARTFLLQIDVTAPLSRDDAVRQKAEDALTVVLERVYELEGTLYDEPGDTVQVKAAKKILDNELLRIRREIDRAMKSIQIPAEQQAA